MRIAVFTTYFAPEVNGLTRYIEGLYGALLRKHPEITVDVYTFDTQKTGILKERRGVFTVYRAECVTMLGGTYAFPAPKGYRRLRRVFHSKTYDIVNTHTRFFVSTFIGALLAKKRGVTLVHTEHGSGFVQHENVMVRLLAFCYDMTLGVFSVRRADAVCAVSESVARFVRRFGAKKIEVVSNGIDIPFWRRETDRKSARVRYGITDGETCIAFVGRLIAAKGCQDLLSALQVFSNYPWRLLVAGDGPYRKKLEEFADRYGVSQNVSFLGALSKGEVRELFHVADIFVNPSRAAEGLPTTLLEATAAGCLCISSDTGGSKDVLPKACLYRVGDVDDLRMLLKEYRSLPWADVSGFGWDAIAEKFFRVLEATKKDAV